MGFKVISIVAKRKNPLERCSTLSHRHHGWFVPLQPSTRFGRGLCGRSDGANGNSDPEEGTDTERADQIRVERETRGDITESFDDYWAPIEAGIGSIPQSYLRLSDVDRRTVRE